MLSSIVVIEPLQLLLHPHLQKILPSCPLLLITYLLLNPTQETFPRYVKRIKNFFSANEVADAKQKYVFLNSLGRKHYNLLSNLLSPAEPEDKSLDELITVLTKHFQPTTSIITERYSFHCCCQIPNESIADFVVGLKKSSTCCQYEPQVQSILLRDRFVCGLAHEATRKRLLTEDNDLTFDQAVEIATNVERASVQARQIKMSDSKVSVNQVKGKQQTSYPINTPKVCYCCGGPYLATTCRFVHETC